MSQTAHLLHETFLGRCEDWQDMDSARREVTDALQEDRISRFAVDANNQVIGWVGGIPEYGGRVWELHPLLVARVWRGRGVGRALVHELEALARRRGGQTLWLGSDDENNETSLSGVDLYSDIPAAIRNFRKLWGEHPCDFYFLLGFCITGVMPDANGPGKPDIFFAKRL
ncbi:aminoglycoside 6'-N-acetyltransferase I [Natronospira proteinivora]|uniref:Aminoglycoside 6'-N-acetyltransferase I n=1 Tax=Natronospira proteinivora TaxID=1807133 RepID=A0ABT1G9I6_9GAMM|nr:GNAT family N-acetyltransferase [Natronospira proteinivora]MCP1726607.1 aminoglycoside 6'-N-acetyltransferase I [Natronospira proteinivora]